MNIFKKLYQTFKRLFVTDDTRLKDVMRNITRAIEILENGTYFSNATREVLKKGNPELLNKYNEMQEKKPLLLKKMKAVQEKIKPYISKERYAHELPESPHSCVPDLKGDFEEILEELEPFREFNSMPEKLAKNTQLEEDNGNS